ncbi:MAG: MBL fold metallo-hydrolase [Candidatus Thorarchaeota archaeon]|nr:MAG: MBL fold metallo-hydrolase [Candidatus Thorarchaeota archaeon]
MDTEITDVTNDIVLMRVVGTKANHGNVTCISLDDGLVFIDTGKDARATSKFRSKMEARFKKKPIFVLLTHTHWDHIFGMEVFSDVPIISSDAGVEAIRKELDGELSKEGRQKVIKQIRESLKEEGRTPSEAHKQFFDDLTNVTITVPSIGVKGEIEFGSEGRRYKYWSIGGHSDCSSVVFCEKEKVLITGDNLVAEHAANSPCMLAGFKPEAIEILESFEQMDVDTFIPGHGPVVGPEYVVKSTEWFSKMFSFLSDLKSKGVPSEKAVSDPALPEFFENATPRDYEHILEFWYNAV